MAVTVRVFGVPQANAGLLRAAERYQSKAQTRKILRPAAVRMREALRGVTAGSFGGPGSQSTGNLARSIRTFSFPRSRMVHVGPRVGGVGRMADGYYFGWQDRGTSRGIRAKNMIDRTITAHGDEVAGIMRAALLADLQYLI
jgi:hypothetical protein